MHNPNTILHLHNSIFKNETTDKFPKRLLSIFIFPSIILSSQFQETTHFTSSYMSYFINNHTTK